MEKRQLENGVKAGTRWGVHRNAKEKQEGPGWRESSRDYRQEYTSIRA